ncbi:MAG TPA: hypothetical protein VGM03_20110 [Phycisphaerae bacterium]|jgi:hypothetical protein
MNTSKLTYAWPVGCLVLALCAGCPNTQPVRNTTTAGSMDRPVPDVGNANATMGNEQPGSNGLIPGDGSPLAGDGTQTPPVVTPEPTCTLPSAPFGESESWILQSNPAGGNEIAVSAFGQGTQMVSIELITDPVLRTSCRADDVEAVVTFDGQRFSLNAAFQDQNGSDTCSVELTADVGACGPSTLAGYPANLFQITGTGRATVGERSYALATLDLIRFLEPSQIPCSGPPRLLTGREWYVSNFEMYSSSFEFDEDQIAISFSGFGDFLEYGDAFRYGDDAAVSCDFSNATVTFDGQTLTVSGQIEATPVDGDVEGPVVQQSCAISFTGTVANCGSLDSFNGLSLPAQSGQLLRIEGTGMLTVEGNETPVNTLFLTVLEPLMPSQELCNEPAPALAEDDYWQITTTDPFPRGADATAGLFTISGEGATIDYVQPEFDANVPPESQIFCFGQPDGSLSFDGQNLTLSLMTQDFAGGIDGLPDGGGGFSGSCSIQFIGTLAECETRVDDRVFYTYQDVRLLRFDGTGMQSSGDMSTPITTIYFVRSSGDFGGGSGFPIP